MNLVNTRYIRAVLAVFLVVGVASASFFVSNRIAGDKSVSPNAPESNPLAAILSEEQYEKIYGEPIRQTTKAPSTKTGKEEDDISNPTSKTVTGTPFQTPQSSNTSSSPTPTKTTPTPTVGTGTSFGQTATAEQKAGNSYMSDASNNCDDGKGFISGTGCFNGERRVLGLPETQAAYRQHITQTTNKIVNTSDTELISLGISSGTVACDETKPDCIKKLVEAGTKVLLNNNLILGQDRERLARERTVNQTNQDVLLLPDKEFLMKYGVDDREAVLFSLGISAQNAQAIVADQQKFEKFTDPNISNSQLAQEVCGADTRCRREFQREDILNGVTSYSPEYINSTITNKKIQEQSLANSNNYYSLYMDRRSDQEVAIDYCKNGNGQRNTLCEKNFVRDDLLSYFDNPNQLVQEKKDLSYAEYYADTKMSDTVLSRIYCDGKTNEINCLREFQRADVLSSINSDSIRQQATQERFNNLNNMIVPLINGQYVGSADKKTRDEAIKLNEDIAHATWVYLAENQADTSIRSGTRLSSQTNEELLNEFNQKLASNPSLLNDYIKKYNENPTSYDQPTIYNNFALEENPLIRAQYNQIIKTQPIVGLFENNNLLSYNKASPEYKQQARDAACEKEKSIQIYCRTLSAGPPSGYAAEAIAKQQADAIAQIDSYLSGPVGQSYIREIYDTRTTNILLSLTTSNLAVVENTSTNNLQLLEEIEKAKLEAERQKQSEQYALWRYGTYMSEDVKKDLSVQTVEERNEIANEYIRRQLVVETYTRGAGISGALASASLATLACSGLGVGAVVCGGVGGLAAAVSNIVPIWGTSTAEEIESERQGIVDFFGGSEFTGTLVQSLYSNQGAYNDESIVGGRSQSTLNNPFALLEQIHNIGLTSTNSITNDQIATQIALQPYLLSQGESLQQENANQAVVNLLISPVVGALTAGAATNLATRVTPTLANNFLTDTALWLAGTGINDIQTQIQFNATSGFVDTQAEINLEVCIRQKGASACQAERDFVTAETNSARDQNRLQAFLTDAIIQAGQTATSYSIAAGNQVVQNLTQSPTRPTDTTLASPQLTELLNLSDPNILNNNFRRDIDNLDSITANNLITSQTLNNQDPNYSLISNFSPEIRNLNNEDTASTSILQATVLYKDLSEADFRIKLTELNFKPNDIDIALNIVNNGENVAYANYLNDLIENNIDAEVRNNYIQRASEKFVENATKRILSDRQTAQNISDYNIEKLTNLTEESFSRLTEFQKNDLNNLVQVIRNAKTTEERNAFIEVLKNTSQKYSNSPPTATVIDTKQEALKLIISEEAKNDTFSDFPVIEKLLTDEGYSPQDIEYIRSVYQTQEVQKAIMTLRDFDLLASKTITSGMNQDALVSFNQSVALQRADLLLKVSQQPPTSPLPNNTLANIKETDADGNIKYTIPELEGVTLFAAKDSTLAKSVNSNSNEITVPLTTKSVSEDIKTNTLITESFKTDLEQMFFPNQLKRFNDNLNDPNYIPKNNFLSRVSETLNLSPESALIKKARRYNYNIDRPLSQIAIDVRTTDNQISRTPNIRPLTKTQREKAITAIPRRLAERMLQVLRKNPNLKISDIDFKDNVRFWSGNYLEDSPAWIKFQEGVKSNPNLSEDQINSVINAAREHLTDYTKSSILSNNPDFVHSPKGPYIDTFIDLNPNRAESLGIMKKFLRPGGVFEQDITLAIRELNNTIRNGGKIKRIAIDKNWNLPNLEVPSFKTTDVITSFGISEEASVNFNFVGNEIYSSVRGENNQILNAVFAGKLRSKLDGLDPNFPIIEQAKSNDPSAASYYYEAKTISLYGKALNPDTITPADVQITKLTDNVDEINLFSQFIYETGTTSESLIASASNSDRNAILSGKLVDLEVNGTTDLVISNTTQIAGDLAGYSTRMDALNKYITSPEGVKEASTIIEGLSTIDKVYQDLLTVALKKVGGKTHEHAGDGVRSISLETLTNQQIASLVETSSLYKDIIDSAANNSYGPKAKRTAEVLNKELGDSVFLKIGVGSGDTIATVHSGPNSLTAEYKSTTNIDQYLDFVKKYINDKKAKKEDVPSKFIGVDKKTYDRFSYPGYTKIETTIGGKPAYLIIKDFRSSTTPRDTQPPIRNSAPKKSVLEVIRSIIPIGITNDTSTIKVNPINENITKGVNTYIEQNLKDTISQTTNNIKSLFKKPNLSDSNKKTVKGAILATTGAFGIPALISQLLSFFSFNINTDEIPSPTPTVTITPTLTPSPTIIITSSPTPTPTIVASPTPTSIVLSAVKSLNANQMSEFALTAKQVGQMVISCQNEGVFKGDSLYSCICKQTANNCSAGSSEEAIARDLALYSDGTRPLECVEFLYSIERTRTLPIATSCEAQFANTMVPNKCANTGDVGSYFCPKSVVETSGFVPGDVIVIEDSNVGHTEVCTELTANGCSAIGANYNKDGLVAFREVTSNNNFSGVWRGGSNIEGCTLY